MSVECELFCRSFEDISIALGRYKNESGTFFSSMYYPNLTGNLANCVVWNSQSNFYQIEIFLSATDKFRAICREFIKVEPLESFSSSNFFNVDQLFCIRQLGEFTVADTTHFVGKCVLLSRGETFLASLVSEGCEHNKNQQIG